MKFQLRRAVVLAVLALLALAPSGAAQADRPAATASSAQTSPKRPPEELFEIERVVDGDTIHIRRNGEVEKLRLLSVDTEEKISGFSGGSASKPATVFGEESALWAREFFAALAPDGGTPKIGLAFPGGREERGTYGRLLCHVLLPDGTDFNLLLVEKGMSPYFNKYGNSEICHEAFVAAQRRAQEARLGIWNPETNAPKTPGAPAARRPYEKLLPWWQARADAIESFRARHREDPAHVADAERPETLARAAQSEGEVEVFASIYELFDERSGDLTVLMRSSEPKRALRVRIPKDARALFHPLELPQLSDEFRQNFVWVKGRLRETPRGFEMRTGDPAAWRMAGPEPVIPEAAAAGR